MCASGEDKNESMYFSSFGKMDRHACVGVLCSDYHSIVAPHEVFNDMQAKSVDGIYPHQV